MKQEKGLKIYKHYDEQRKNILAWRERKQAQGEDL